MSFLKKLKLFFTFKITEDTIVIIKKLILAIALILSAYTLAFGLSLLAGWAINYFLLKLNLSIITYSVLGAIVLSVIGGSILFLFSVGRIFFNMIKWIRERWER